MLMAAWGIHGRPLGPPEYDIKERVGGFTQSPSDGEVTLVFRDAAGNPRTVAEFAGKPLVMNVWATWCAPCVQELPVLAALQARYGDRLHVIAISVDAEGFTQVNGFFARHAIARPPVYWDADTTLFRHLKIGGLPTTFVFDAKGRIVATLERGIEAEDKELLPLLNTLTGG